jgi:ATP-dependent RNA helicase MSS116, mitochondrial
MLLRPAAGSTISLLHVGRRLQQTVAAAADQSSADSVPPFSAHAEGLATKFEDLETRGLVHPNVVNTITKYMNLETMTEVQSRTINEALKGADMYVSGIAQVH